MPLNDSSEGRHQEAETLVADLMRSSGWQVDALHDSKGGGADLVIYRNGQQFAVELKSLAEGRADRALPLLSLAVLQAKAHARKLPGVRPLAVLVVGHASPSFANHLRSFAENYAEGVAVGVVSGNGLQHFVGHPFEELNVQPRITQWSGNRSSHTVVNLFSDLNQWMLKILLAKEIPEPLLNAPRTDCRNGTELAAAAGASAMSASRLLQQLRREGFLDESSQGLCLVRRKELFDRWRAAVVRPALEMPMRFVLRAPVREQLRDLIAKQSGGACLGLFAAAEELRFGHVSGVPAHIYVPQLPQSEERKWRSVRPTTPADAPDLVLRQAAFPESTFRGAVHREGTAATDVIQTWLDVGNHPARGSEQAELIYDKFLRGVVEQSPR